MFELTTSSDPLFGKNLWIYNQTRILNVNCDRIYKSQNNYFEQYYISPSGFVLYIEQMFHHRKFDSIRISLLRLVWVMDFIR